LGIAAALSLVGTWVIAFVQTKNASIQADQVDTSNWLYWVGAALLTVGSVMITNGAIQVRLKNPIGQKFWSLGNTEISQFAISVFGIILIVVIGVFLMITYWFVSLILGASFGVESGDNTNAKFFVLAIVSVFFGLLIAIRLTPLPAYVADRNLFAVEASWRATRGHFWRITAGLLLVTVFYAVLWTVGALIAAILSMALFNEPSDAAGNWLQTYIDMFSWPFTIYGQIAVCALLGSIYQQLVLESSETDDHEVLEPGV
jgi:hypothetical protein